MDNSFVTNKEGFIHSVFFARETSDHSLLSHFYDLVCVCVGGGVDGGDVLPQKLFFMYCAVEAMSLGTALGSAAYILPSAL